MANKPEEFEQFTPVGSVVLKAWMDKLKRYLHNVVAAVIGIQKTSDIKFNRSILYEIFNRIEKRRVYFHIYHNGMEMGEVYEGALLCFWILKLMPFRTENLPTSLLNTQIAYIIFVNMLNYVANKINKENERKGLKKPKTKMNVKQKLMNDVMYAFQYRDLSKEAIMALADSHLYMDYMDGSHLQKPA
jgi:hypothetical protein